MDRSVRHNIVECPICGVMTDPLNDSHFKKELLENNSRSVIICSYCDEGFIIKARHNIIIDFEVEEA